MDEIITILQKFAASGWPLIAQPAQAYLDGAKNRAALIAALERADIECGSCGCEFDPLYKRLLAMRERL